MCGYLGNVTDSPLTRALMILLGMEDALPTLHNNPGTGPASAVEVILQDERGRHIQSAVWWLLLERDPRGGHKPSKYTSFNTRSDKLEQKRSAGYGPYRMSRCIVPASYFIEGEGPKGARRYHPSWLHLTSAQVNNGLPRLLAVRERLRALGSKGLDWRPQTGSH